MKSLWFPGVVRHPGPAEKTTGTRARTRGAVYHSSVGDLGAALSVLANVSKRADGTYRYGSWHMTNAKDGRLFQHYPLDVLTWHARGGNNWSIGVENEGGPIGNEREPLTEAQVTNLVELSAWLVEEGWLPGLTRTGDKTLWEHREIQGSSTACPSGRIPWAEIIERAEDSMLAEDLAQLRRDHNTLLKFVAESVTQLRRGQEIQNTFIKALLDKEGADPNLLADLQQQMDELDARLDKIGEAAQG